MVRVCGFLLRSFSEWYGASQMVYMLCQRDISTSECMEL